MNVRPCLEFLERRLLLSIDLALTAGQVYPIHQDAVLHALTEAPGALIPIDPGVRLTLAGGTSQIQGAISFGDPSSSLEFDGGAVTIQGATIGGSDPTPGSVYAHEGASVSVKDSVFTASYDNGVIPGLSTIDSLTTSTVFSGHNLFWGYAGLTNFALLTLAGGTLDAASVTAEAGTLTVTGAQTVSGTVYTGDRADARLAVETGASLSAADVYLAAPASLAGAVSGPTITLSAGPLPFSTFADATVVNALTSKRG